MAIERLTFGAHQANKTARTGTRRVANEPIETGLKIVLPRHRFVVGNAVAIQFRTRRPAAERRAIGKITDAVLLQERLQVLCGEPRTKPRERRGAHIGNRAHASRAQHGDEAVRRDVGVTDAEKIKGGHDTTLSPSS